MVVPTAASGTHDRCANMLSHMSYPRPALRLGTPEDASRAPTHLGTNLTGTGTRNSPSGDPVKRERKTVGAGPKVEQHTNR